MRVLAASFPDDASARAARTQLLDAFHLDPGQIGVEALAAERNVSDVAILAGRFREDTVQAARELVEQHQGTLVMDIDDAGSNA
jgi:hypothetical protein